MKLTIDLSSAPRSGQIGRPRVQLTQVRVLHDSGGLRWPDHVIAYELVRSPLKLFFSNGFSIEVRRSVAPWYLVALVAAIFPSQAARSLVYQMSFSFPVSDVTSSSFSFFRSSFSFFVHLLVFSFIF